MANVTGLEALLKAKLKLEKFKYDFITEVNNRIKVRTPVDTGKLQAGFTAHVEGDMLYITNPVDYCDYVEWGTEKMAPVHMILITAHESQAIADEIAKKDLT